MPVSAALYALALGASSAFAQESYRPLMDPSTPVHCVRDVEGQTWRVQCDERSKICLFAPNEELDSRGHRSKPLERATPCAVADNRNFDREHLQAQGYTLQPGRPDAPWGWTRDDRGRVFQVNFDLRRRLYLGGSYSPLINRGSPAGAHSYGIDFGLFVFEHFGGQSNPTRHRIRLVQGDVRLSPFSADLVLAHYDLSRRFIEPLFRLTTFVGEPQRHDLYINIGLWSQAGALEVHHTPVSNSSLWTFGDVQATLDLWQNERIDSYARLRTGVALEGIYTEAIGDRAALTGKTAFEIDWTVDDTGFHNVGFVTSYERPQYLDARPDIGERARRWRTQLQYELILLALNDQPISLFLGAGASKRNDIPGLPDRWALRADTGLRFSLWAPPRPE